MPASPLRPKSKQYELKADDVVDLIGFANEAGRRGAIGIVFALGVNDASRNSLEGLGVEVLRVEDMLDFVRLWEPVRQRIAVSSFVYYVKHVEQNSSLADRLDAFLGSQSGAEPLLRAKRPSNL